jgi:hypothetical protein
VRIDRGLRGFRGADVFRGEEDGAVAFVTLTRFESLDAIRAFAGDTYEGPVLEPTARSSTTPAFSRPHPVEVGIGPVISRGYSNRRARDVACSRLRRWPYRKSACCGGARATVPDATTPFSKHDLSLGDSSSVEYVGVKPLALAGGSYESCDPEGSRRPVISQMVCLT